MELLKDRLAKAMKARGVTPKDIYTRKILSKAGIYFLLDGTTTAEKVRDSTVASLCTLLKINRAWLLAGDGPMDSTAKSERLFKQGSTEKTSPEGTLLRLEGDILSLRQALSLTLAALARSTPAAAADILAGLQATPGSTHGYLAEAVTQIREAQRATAAEQLSALRPAASSSGRKT